MVFAAVVEDEVEGQSSAPSTSSAPAGEALPKKGRSKFVIDENEVK